MKNTILIGLVALFIIAGSATAKDLFVPSEYKTIQAAVDDANDSDTVIVADGTYTGNGNRDIDFKGKAITVMSETGPENCIIDCQGGPPPKQPGCGFIFTKGEDANSVLDGFTITNGYNGCGSGFGRCGAIRCLKSSPTITNCIIRDNIGTAGGGIFCEFKSSPTIINCIIIGNKARGNGLGCGICCTAWSSPTITDCIISGNSAKRGGGIYCGVESSPTITNCTISGNSAFESGGGLYCGSKSSPTIASCIISGNKAWESGGALFCRDKAAPKITNCTICDNAQNESSGGGGIVCWDSAPKIKNSILWNNLPNEVFAISASPQLTYCNIEGGWKGEGNIDTDPLFVMDDPYGVTGTWTAEPAQSHKTNRTTLIDSSASFATGELVGELIYANETAQDAWRRRQSIITANTNTSIEVIFIVGSRESGGDKGNKYRLIDYYLQPGSPCIDAGTAEGTPATDIQGRTRDAKPDIGAYETGF